MDPQDDSVFTWNEGSGLEAQTVYANDSLGTKNTVDPAAIPGASIVMQPAAGNYALSWVDSNYGGFTDFYSNVNAGTFLLSGQVEQPSFQVYGTTTYPIQQSTAAAIDGNGDVLVIYSGFGYLPNGGGVATDSGVFGDFYLDPPATASPNVSSPTNVASPSASPAAATDAAFAAYAYPEDDDTLS